MNLPDEEAIIYFDGGAWPNPGPAACAAVVYDKNGNFIVEHFLNKFGESTNNYAEFKGLILAMDIALIVNAFDIILRTDSQLVANCMNGEWRLKHPMLIPLADQARTRFKEFDSYLIQWVPREQNTRADALCSMALGRNQKVTNKRKVKLT